MREALFDHLQRVHGGFDPDAYPRLLAAAGAWKEGHRPSGLTVSGGEPTDQAQVVRALIKGFRHLFPETEVALYTGLHWPVLMERSPHLVELLDAVVAGPYARSLEAMPLAGSANQEVKLLTPLAERLYQGWRNWPRHALQVGQTRTGEASPWAFRTRRVWRAPRSK